MSDLVDKPVVNIMVLGPDSAQVVAALQKVTSVKPVDKLAYVLALAPPIPPQIKPVWPQLDLPPINLNNMGRQYDAPGHSRKKKGKQR